MSEQSSGELREAIIAAIREVHDPEIPVNLYDLGLIYGIEIAADGSVDVTMTLTTPNCPVAELIPQQVKEAAESVEGVGVVRIELVWEPRWTGEMMAEDAKLQLEMMGISWADPVPHGSKTTGLTIGRQRPNAGQRD